MRHKLYHVCSTMQPRACLPRSRLQGVISGGQIDPFLSPPAPRVLQTPIRSVASTSPQSLSGYTNHYYAACRTRLRPPHAFTHHSVLVGWLLYAYHTLNGDAWARGRAPRPRVARVAF